MQNETLTVVLLIALILGTGVICLPLCKGNRRCFWLFLPVFLCLTFGYIVWGGYFPLLDYNQTLARKHEVDQILSSPEKTRALIQRMITQLDSSPSSASGWVLVGKLYLVVGEQDKARSAFEKARQLRAQP